MKTVYLLLGGNIGNTKEYFEKAKLNILDLIGKIIKESNIYVSEPWGFEADKLFLNQALKVKTILAPQELLEKINFIENKHDRKRESKVYSSRTLDIDILFYGNEIINEENLQIPHIHLQNRKFALEPLNEIAPQLIHPKLNKNIKQLLESCNDNSIVEKL